MGDLIQEPKVIVRCKCSKTLDVDDIYYKEYGNTQIIIVNEHECLRPSWTIKCGEYNDWLKEYYSTGRHPYDVEGV